MPLLLSRTHFSLLTAPTSPQALCEEAVRLGLTHLVLTDTNALYGLYPFAKAARRVGLQAVFGCELVHRGLRLTLIAQDERGYSSLCSLLSAFHGVGPDRAGSSRAGSSRAGGGSEFDLVRACERYAKGLWFVCGDPRLLPELSVRVPRERLLVALPPRPLGGEPARDMSSSCLAADSLASSSSASSAMSSAMGTAGARIQRGRKLPDPGCPWPRRMLRDIARDLDLKLCAVRDVWFAAPQDHALHQLFLAVKWSRSLRGGDPAKDLHGIGVASPEAHLPSKDQLHLGHEEDAAAVAMAQQVLDSCTLSFADRAKPIFPPVSLPKGVTAGASLRRLVLTGLQQRYGKQEQAAIARCDHELSVIESMGFSPYFLAVHQIVELARARDIPFVGRGSAADSLVAHCLGLTDADPLRYGLLFERFLNPGRSDLPDIDLDFCWRRRDELIEAVYEHFGRDHVAMIATYNTCGPRSAYQEAAKVLGLPPAEAVRRSKRLPWHGKAELDLAAIAAATPGFWREGSQGGRQGGGTDRGTGSVHDSKHLPPEREQLLLSLAQQLLSAPRHLGVHPGGIVITPQPIATYAPLERAAKGVVVTQYDMHFVEGLGMVKIDLLGNRALSIVHDCVTMLQGHGVVVPDLHMIPEDDARTAKLLSTGGTLGCFQVESPAMRTLLQQMGAKTMDRVIQAVALVRPGPAAAGMKDAFIRRARGLEPVTTAHPLLSEVFADTFGIMLYQEDVIRAAMAVAGLDATEGDMLRRDLGKHALGAGGHSHALRDEADAFVVAGLRRGLPRAAIEQVWAEMARFAAYSFCKAHSVTYGRLAYRCVFLKARWPAAFLAAMLRNDAGYFAQGVYAEEAKRLGAELRAPCIQEGVVEHELLRPTVIRIGLASVHGLGERTVSALLTARRAGGPFRTLQDFLQRVRPMRNEVENLIMVGACDGFGMTRPELLWRLQVAMTPRAQKVAERTAVAARGALFADAVMPREASYPQLPDYDEAKKGEAELRLLGFTLGSHPVDVLWRRGELPVLRQCVPCGKVAEHLNRTVRICGFAVAFRGHSAEQGGMCFVTVEDGTGIVETTLFAKVYQRCGGVLQGRGPFVFEGKAEERLGGGVGMRVFDVMLPEDV
ncbi:MAG: DNA-directed DNA polymerase III PolC [Candidatus Azotimanducaceae bacterium]|jgi:DNA-directed DNA polymerase III PolC